MRLAPEVKELVDREATSVTFNGLRMRQALRAQPILVHGLVELHGKAIVRRLPFQFAPSEDQGVFVCVCNTGWLTICPRPDADAAYRKHIEAARDSSTS